MRFPKENQVSTIVIKSKPKWQIVDLGELWRFRELFYIFTWRDIKVRYKQTVLGIAWVVFQPLFTTFIFTLFFGRLAKIPSGSLPYEVFVLIGLVFWNFFSQAITRASSSFIENVSLLKKVYFPKEILPISAGVTSFVDFIINFFVLLLVGLYFGFWPSIHILYLLPICMFIIMISSSGIGLLLSSINVKYRDVRYILPFFIQLMLFLTPVIYPTSTLRDSIRFFFSFNPMTGVIESMRFAFGGSTYLDYKSLFIAIFVSILFLMIGLVYFRLTERYFADIS